MNPEMDFAEAMAHASLTPPEKIVADGRLHRFSTNGKRGDDAGWYVLHLDGVPAGAFGCWRDGINGTWCADIGRTLTPAEIAENRARIERARREAQERRDAVQARAAERAFELLCQTDPAPATHGYLLRKRVKPYGLRLFTGQLVIRDMDCHGALVVPIRDIDGKLWSLEFIDADGEKRFLPGGRKGGCFFGIGQLDDVIVVAEGFATGATVHRATGYPVAVAFDAGNVTAVAVELHKRFPTARICTAGDNDL